VICARRDAEQTRRIIETAHHFQNIKEEEEKTNKNKINKIENLFGLI